MQDEQPLKPANILNIVATNQGKRTLTTEIPRSNGLTAAQVQEYMDEGVFILDARSSAEFGSGHIPGAINVQLSGDEFEQRVGWMLPDDSRMILVTNSEADAQTAIYKMAFIALDSNVIGHLSGGMTAWMNAGQALATVPQMDVHALKHKLSVNGLQVVDVRDQEEWDEGHIDGAHFMPYTSMVTQLDIPGQLGQLDIDKDQSVAVTCATGKRSSTAVSVMMQAGYTNVYNITGGMVAWSSAGFPMLDGEGNVCPIL